MRKEIQREFRTNLGGERGTVFTQELENSAGSGDRPEKLFYKGKYFGPKLPTFLPVFMLFLSILTHFENKMYKILALRANFEHTFTFDLISSQNREEIRKFPLAGGGEIWDFGLSIYPWLFSSGEMTEMTAGSGDQFLPNRVERVAVLAHLTPPETVYH